MDSEGLLLKAKVHSAKVPDQDGLRLLLESARGGLSRLKHLWLEAGYEGRGRRWAEEVMVWNAVDRSGQRPQRSETRKWRPGGAHLVALFVLIAAGALVGAFVGSLLGWDYRGEEASGNAALWGFQMLLLTWLVALPLSQYLLLRQAGARPRLGWSSFPAPFGLLRAPGYPLSRERFAVA